ncbi:hypothetical protein SLEP1_g12616 [Rubroshorea leprosula]|uniref:Uncharacterized protein n=1 Tax=Rubroshorea leprosula TaxID=152421 RepID=A0AAV5IHK7_9ROSI|nr:hypothetical protein SLEP1_g12616 [Rubroshorea leprosula]
MLITPAGSFPIGIEEVHNQPQQKQEQVTKLSDHFHGLNSSSLIRTKSNGSNSTPLPVKKKTNLPGTPAIGVCFWGSDLQEEHGIRTVDPRITTIKIYQESWKITVYGMGIWNPGLSEDSVGVEDGSDVLSDR